MALIGAALIGLVGFVIPMVYRRGERLSDGATGNGPVASWRLSWSPRWRSAGWCCHGWSVTARAGTGRRRQPSRSAALDPDGTVPDGSLPPASGSAGCRWRWRRRRRRRSGCRSATRSRRPGVRAAAVTWVSSLGELLQMGPIARDETLRALLSRRAFDETVEEFRAERDRFSAQFGRDVSQAVWRDAPLTVQIVSAESTRAVVEVWSVLLFGTTERAGRDAVAHPLGDAGVGGRGVAGRRRDPP